MSGSLSTLSGLTSGVPGLGALGSLISSQLSLASWRGVPFYMPTGEEESGNRVVQFRYPGLARSDFQFLGALDGPMRLDGMLIGSDCVRQAEKMRAACQASGKGRLVHPWFGIFDAVLTEPARFSVSEAQLGMVRFSATFERFLPTKPPMADFFGRLQDSIDGLMGQARGLMADVMGALDAPLALYSFASGLLQTAVGVWDGLGLGTGGSAVQAATASATLALAVAAPAFDSDFAGTVADLLAAPALAIAAASQPLEQSAIGAGPTAVLSAPDIDPADAAPVLLAAAAAFMAPAAALPEMQAIVLAAQMQAIGQAAAVGATIGFASTADAAAWRDQVGGALATLQAQAAQLATVLPLPVGAAWRAIDAVRVAAIADCNARAVDLPAVQSITTLQTMDAWRIALTLYGDTPARMADAVVDLWRRNLVSNPAIMPPGTYAVLA